MLKIMTVRKIKRIKTPPGAVKRICNDLGVKQTLVYDALRYKSDSDTAERIRHEALNRYGGITIKDTVFK